MAKRKRGRHKLSTRQKISRALKGKKKKRGLSRKKALASVAAGSVLGITTVESIRRLKNNPNINTEENKVRAYRAGETVRNFVDSIRDTVKGSKPSRFFPRKGERGKSRRLKTNKRGFRNVRPGFIGKREVIGHIKPASPDFNTRTSLPLNLKKK